MDYNKLEFIVKEILKKYPECKYEIKRSQKSDSIYLYITDGYLLRSIRISDHRNGYNYFFNTEVVSDKIKDNSIRGAIVNLCKSMQRSRTRYLFNMVSNQLQQTACL